MPVVINVNLISTTSPEFSNHSTDDASEQHPSLMCKVSLFVIEKLHYPLDLPGQVTQNQTPANNPRCTHYQYKVNILPDQSRVFFKSDESATYYRQQLLTTLNQRDHKLLFSDNFRWTWVYGASKSLMEIELERMTIEFAKEEYNRRKCVPLLICANVAMNCFDEFVIEKRLFGDDLDSCSICLRQFEENDRGLVKTPCSHIFHGQCVIDWFRAKRSCPICRHEFAVSLY
ncbi:hypothetical protein ACFE04_013798 [Oxalis oulophora]